MKKLLVLAISLAGFASAKAQEGSEQTWLLQGNIMYTNSGSNTSNFQLNPQIGYQFDKNWTVGLDLGVGSEEKVSSNYKVGVFGRYAWTLSPIFRTYLQAQVGFGRVKPDGGGASTNRFYIDLGPGIAVNLKNNFCLNFGFGVLGYNSTKLSTSGSPRSNKFVFQFGSAATIGVSKNFGGKK